MTSDVPWQVTGVRRQAREAAREAARRSGLSVGEWLDAVILDMAPPAFGGASIRAPAASDPLARPHARERSSFEQHLREIDSQIETLRQSGCDRAIEALRGELAEIGLVLREAVPRRAVEALQHEVRQLADRLDDTRDSVADRAALVAVERGLEEMRDALRGLTPAEGLLGVARVVQQLAQKVDVIGRHAHNPAALKQLEGAIAAMRGIVSHVASNDALAKLSEEVRALAGKIDDAADRAGTSILSALEGRIAILADALEARNRKSQNVPHELEVPLKGLLDRIERTQLTHAGQSALGQIESRMAILIEKLEASDARFDRLQDVERGLKELLVHLESPRLTSLADAAASPRPELDALSRDLADLRQTEKKTQDSLEVVHGTLGHVVDRLAMIETDLRGRAVPPPDAAALPQPAPLAPDLATTAEPPAVPKEHASLTETASIPERRKPLAAAPIEHGPAEGLPSDPPLEPASGAARGRNPGSPAGAKPSVIADRSGKADFIAAARRAAAAGRDALASNSASPPGETGPTTDRPVSRVVGRLRALIVGTNAS